MIPSFDPGLWRRASWTVLSLALVALVCLGLAEQGSHGGGLQVPPSSPLPFERHRVFGLDLSNRSSLDALNWLNAAGNPSLALIYVPVDADVVQSLASQETQETGLLAIEALQQAAGASPLAVCLRRPADTVGGLAIAQASIEAIRGRFSGQVVYASACEPDDNPEWQRQIDQAIRPSGTDHSNREVLVPLTSTGLVVVDRLDDTDDIDADRFRLRSSGTYMAFRVEVDEPLSGEVVGSAVEAMTDTSHSALILMSPGPNADPPSLVGSFGTVIMAGTVLPEGFSGVGASAIQLNDDWQRSSVGTVNYLRATSSSAALSTQFVGTDIYLVGITSPDSGVVNVWIDPESPTALPTVVLDLGSFQARDSAILIASGLPAARHQITIQAIVEADQSVAISGLFVTGRPATAWTQAFAVVVVLGVAVVALTERCYASVDSIRRRSGPPRRRPRSGHPRVFARDR